MATDDDLTCDSTDSDFFKFLMVYGPSEIVSLVFSAVSLVSVPLLLYSIIWFDNFGSDKKRTLINRLVSSFCAASSRCASRSSSQNSSGCNLLTIFTNKFLLYSKLYYYHFKGGTEKISYKYNIKKLHVYFNVVVY